MYGAAVAPSRGGRAAWPLAAICCLGILAFLVAATIVLALIPVYLPTKQANRGSATVVTTVTTTTTTATTTTTTAAAAGQFNVQYQATPTNNPDDSVTGTINNAAALGGTLGVGGLGQFTNGQTQSTFNRRKRGLLNRRRKRALITNLFFTCVPIFSATCITTSCQNTAVSTLQAQLQSRAAANFTNVVVTVTTGGGGVTRNITYSVVAFIGFPTTIPTVTTGSSSLNFTAAQTGLFNSTSTWSGGIIPYGNCTVTIPAGITVTIPGPQLPIRVTIFDVSGTLAVGQGSSSFQFVFATTIIVRSGGTFQDLTTGGTIILPEESFYTALNGSTSPDNTTTTLQVGAGSRKRAVGDRIGFLRSPSTCGCLRGRPPLNFPRVNPICRQSGSITVATTFLGGVIPSNSLCGGGCGLYVSIGVTLTTSALNGRLTIQITVIVVVSGAVLDLGTSGSPGFSFSVAVTIQVSGGVTFSGNGGSIGFPVGSNFNLAAGATFTSQVSVSFTFTNSAGVVVATISIGTSLTGPGGATSTPDGSVSFFNSTTTVVVAVGTGATTTTTVAGATTTTTAAGGASGATTTTTAAGGASGATTTTTAAGGASGASGATTTTTTAAATGFIMG